ncbi:ATP-binding protein [Nonomuraea dietziae]|uniref:ATP-binding protein n=1 Tax=Nonomuraea dietziae TaxID=65515 RepID=UPI0033D23728
MQLPITSDLVALREHVHVFGRRAGLDDQRAQDLVIVANEAATNVLDHGGGSGTLIALSDKAGVRLEIVDVGCTLSEAHLAPDSNPIPAAAWGSG